MTKVVIEILQGSAVTQTMLDKLVLSVAASIFPVVCDCWKLWRLVRVEVMSKYEVETFWDAERGSVYTTLWHYALQYSLNLCSP